MACFLSQSSCAHWGAEVPDPIAPKLNSSLSSTLSTGVTFCHFLSDKNGLARYDLSATRLIDYDGSVDGDPTDQQRQGIQRMYQILQKAGKTSSNITYDFQFK